MLNTDYMEVKNCKDRKCPCLKYVKENKQTLFDIREIIDTLFVDVGIEKKE